jgi:tetratricopeptide (TPR) repeat protein
MPDRFISRQDAEADMLTAAAFLAENIASTDGRAEAMKTIIPLYLGHGNVDLAAELANQIDEPYSRDRMLILVAEKCAQIDDDEYALQLGDAVEDEGLRGQVIERIALAKVKNGQLEKAAEYAAAMEHPAFVHGGIAVKQAEAGDDTAATETLASIDFPAARVSSLIQMANQKIENGDPGAAAERIELAVAAAKEIEHDEERLRALCDAGQLFIEAKRNDKAIETLDTARSEAEALDNVHRDHFLVSCAFGFLKAGSSDLADKTLDLVTDKTEMAAALLAFSREDWNAGQKDDALETLDEGYEILKSQRDIETRNSQARNALMTQFAVQFAGYGKTEKGVEIAKENLDPEEEMNGLGQIAQILTMQKEDELARETIDMIAEDSNRLIALISVSDTHEKGGSRDKAIEVLEEAATFAEGVPQLASRSNALNELAQRFAEYGKPDRARELSLINLDVIAEIRDESSRAAALAGLASVYEASALTPDDAAMVKVGLMLHRI